MKRAKNKEITLKALKMGLVILFITLSGCATTKPEMLSNDYAKYSRSWVAVHSCNTQGFIDSGTAATGLRYVQSNINHFTFNPDTLKENMDWVAGNSNPITETECRKLALVIQQRKQQIELNNSNASIQQQALQDLNNNRPKQTYCNKIGTQVFCTTY